MEPREITAALDRVQAALAQSKIDMETVSEAWHQLVIENQELKTENHYLRERLAMQGDAANDSEQLSPALQNLMNIYEDGYHICNISYGQRRQDEEQCMFCLEILQGNHS